MALVTLNVGGTVYTTAASTLCRLPDSMLARMFDGDLPPAGQDSKGRHFIDRDGDAFKWIIRYLRDEKASLPASDEQRAVLKAEAEYYQLDGLVERLRKEHIRFRVTEAPVPVILPAFHGRAKHPKDPESMDIALTSSISPSEEAKRLKMDWIRKYAPMSDLHRAMEALLWAFWDQEPHEQSLPPSCHLHLLKGDTYTNRGTELGPDHFEGPSALLFLEALQFGKSDQGVPQRHHIPVELQETVQRYFILFCYELSQLGYCVHEKKSIHSSAGFNTSSFFPRLNHKRCHYINIAGSEMTAAPSSNGGAD